MQAKYAALVDAYCIFIRDIHAHLIPYINKKVWWKCAEGHVWKTVIYSRTGMQRCGYPVCAGRAKHSVKLDPDG